MKPAHFLLQEVVVYLAKTPSFWLLLAAGSVRNIPGYALGAWLPTFYALEHQASPSSYGVRVGLVVVFGGGLGSFLGGFLADRYDILCVCIVLVGTKWGGLSGVHSYRSFNKMSSRGPRVSAKAWSSYDYVSNN